VINSIPRHAGVYREADNTSTFKLAEAQRLWPELRRYKFASQS
jgi:hypothetical protein